MDIDGSSQTLSWYYLSGDWLTLEEASAYVSTELKSNPVKKPTDILKAGYMSFANVPERLSLFVPVRQGCRLRPVNVPQNIGAPKIGFIDYMVFVGDAFQLHPKAIEALTMLGEIDNSHIGAFANARIYSDKAMRGWLEYVDWSDRRRLWYVDIDCMVDPLIKVQVSDIRVDGVELREFVQKVRDVDSKNRGHTDQEASSITVTQSAQDGPDWAWIAAARNFAEEVYSSNPRLSNDQISKKVHQKMVEAVNAGQPGMTGRGGRVPSDGTIKRRALAGLKVR